MHDKGLYETPEEFQQRVDVLQLLLELVPEWVKTVARHLGKPEAEVADADGSVLTYGSFRLSTHGPGVDRHKCKGNSCNALMHAPILGGSVLLMVP